MPRTITVTLQDGSQHTYQNAPDDVTPDQVSARAQSEFGQGVAHLDGGRASQAAPAAAPEPSIMQRMATSTPVRMARGAFDPIAGTIQAAAHLGANYLGGNPEDAQFLDSQLQKGEQHYQADRAATGQSGLDLARLGGNIVSPVNFALPELAPLRVAGAGGRVASALMRAGNGAANGAVIGSMQPVLDGGDYGSEKATQTALGAAGGSLGPVIGGTAKLGGKLVRGLVGETTGAGATSLSHAFAAGKAGGDSAKAFTDSMRGEVPWGQVVDDAKAALGNLRTQRGEAYRNGMLDVSKDATVLNFDDVDRALENTAGIKAYRGRSGAGPAQDLAPKAADARQEVLSAIDEWKALDPADFHTPEGFDALKQKLGVIKDTYQYGTPQWKIASEAYNAVRNSVAKQAPTYNKVMQGYNEASDEITSLEKELSLGKKVNPNTALRKLQSVMRDNANTSWGQRSAMADRLAEAGAPNLLPSLAGQALSTPIPRGLAKYADAMALLHYPSLGAAAGLPIASPRAMGELAYGAGQVARGATALGNLPVIRALPKLPVGSLGVGLPQLLANPAINGAQ